MNLVKPINTFKEFKENYFDFREFSVEGKESDLLSFIKEGVRLHFINEVNKEIKFPCTLSGSRILHFKVTE